MERYSNTLLPMTRATLCWMDLPGKTEEEINATLEEWSSQPFEQVDSPMNEFIMVAMPDGYNGIYLRIDHRLTDSTGMILMINDIMGLYCHFAYGAPMPEDPPLYHLALEKDLAKEDNASRTAKDRAFWEEQVAIGEPIYTDVTGRWKLEACRKKYGNPLLRAADREMDDLRVGRAIYHLEPEPTRRLMDYCMENEISMTNLLLMGLRTYLSKMNDGEKMLPFEIMSQGAPRYSIKHPAGHGPTVSPAGPFWNPKRNF